jgi:hypothetical protein
MEILHNFFALFCTFLTFYVLFSFELELVLICLGFDSLFLCFVKEVLLWGFENARGLVGTRR